MSLRVAVMGATGRFAPIVPELLRNGHGVRAVTRWPESAAAHGLRELGAEVVVGDFADPLSLRSALAGVDAVFAGGTAHKAGPRGEQQHGFNLAEAVKATGRPHLVYVSGAGADRSTGVPVLESKRAVEARLREVATRTTTILAPVYLMENLFNPWNRAALHAGKLPLALPSTRSLQQVATVDVAAFAVVALEGPSEFAGERVELAGDELTGPQAARSLSHVSGREFQFEQTDLAELPFPELARLFEWLAREPFAVDIARLRELHPGLGWHSFEEWAASNDWARLRRECVVG
jgi:uncharacterized protein YbjT (DUF2867 family)